MPTTRTDGRCVQAHRAGGSASSLFRTSGDRQCEFAYWLNILFYPFIFIFKYII